MRLYGAELEKTIADQTTWQPHVVGQEFFRALREEAERRGKFLEQQSGDLAPDRCIGVVSDDLGTQGLDNGFSLLETALPPVDSLDELARRQFRDLASVEQALAAEGGAVINMSIHPLGRRDLETYRHHVAPKGIYRYLWYRGWDHTAGIDGRSQNSPSTSIDIDHAADAVSVIIGAGAAFIALFANSPFAEGQISGVLESRLSLWERMFAGSRAESDRRLARFPSAPFSSLGDYFTWMFGPGTSMHFTHATNSQDYRSVGDSLVLVQGNPSLLEYLEKPYSTGYRFDDVMVRFPPREVIKIKPSLRHLELMQWAQFSGARVRFQFKDHDDIAPDAFAAACRSSTPGVVERLLESHTTAMWIEGRDPGAQFPDREIGECDSTVAQSVMISPAALQAGLLRNLDEAIRFIRSQNWSELGTLREVAISKGLSGTTATLSVRRFTEQIVEISSRGLDSAEHRYLAYPEYVLRTGRNGANRQLEWFERYCCSDPRRLPELVAHRRVVLPQTGYA